MSIVANIGSLNKRETDSSEDACIVIFDDKNSKMETITNDTTSKPYKYLSKNDESDIGGGPTVQPVLLVPPLKRARSRQSSDLKSGIYNMKVMEAENRGTRRRTKTNRFDSEDCNNDEERLIQQALRNSRIETKKSDFVAPPCPVFYPTVEEFKNPLEYIKKIQPEGQKYGICQIVPPSEWKAPCHLDLNSTVTFPTKQQKIDTLQEGVPFDDGKQYTFSSYKETADKLYTDWVAKYYGHEPPCADLAREYWDIVETRKREVAVDYGNDLDTTVVGSGFFQASPQNPLPADEGEMFGEDYYKKTGWNLNNLPSVEGSVLRHVQTPINGINVPWLYCGMLFSTFCWHNEDNYLFSINYHHIGAPKQWYGVPGANAKQFEKVSKDFLHINFKISPDLLHHLTTQISPSLLHANDIPVYSALHTAGSYIITFAQAYHCGFSYGFNIGEAVNFATMDWIPFGFDSDERYRTFGRPQVFSMVRLLFTLLHHTSSAHVKNIELLRQARRVIDEELTTRPALLAMGVRSVTNIVTMPTNSFLIVDQAAMDYDDRRTCCVCKCVCVFSAVACECNNLRVSCLRHENYMCKCNKSRKFILEWASKGELKGLLGRIETLGRLKAEKDVDVLVKLEETTLKAEDVIVIE